MSRYRRQLPDRFDSYRQLTARKGGTCCQCKCDFNPGDVIGWHPTNGKSYCPHCWTRWAEENREAQAYEDSLPYGMFDY